MESIWETILNWILSNPITAVAIAIIIAIPVMIKKLSKK